MLKKAIKYLLLDHSFKFLLPLFKLLTNKKEQNQEVLNSSSA